MKLRDYLLEVLPKLPNYELARRGWLAPANPLVLSTRKHWADYGRPRGS